MVVRALCAAILLAATTAQAGDIGTWKNYTSMKSVTGVTRAETSGAYWASTTGGLFRWDSGTNTFSRYTSADGLRSIDLRAVCVDAGNRVWVGSSTGILQALDPSTGTLATIVDIADANQTNKGINALTPTGDTILVSTEFGLSVFRISAFEFGDTYTRFGNIPPNIRVAVRGAITYAGKLWATVTDGQSIHRVAVGDLSNPNLLPPESWTLYTVGPPANVPAFLTQFNNQLYCGGSTGLFVFDGSGWSAVPGFPELGIRALTSSSTALIACTQDNTVLTIDVTGTITPYGTPAPFSTTAVTSASDGQPVLGCDGGGLLTYSSEWVPRLPNGPNSNAFSSVAVDPDGVVWGASGPANGSGFYRFDGGEWRAYTRSTYPLPYDEMYRVSVTCDGNVWVSSWGGGVVSVDRATATFDTSDVFNQNIGMVGISVNPVYIVTSNVVCDSRGNRWMTILEPADRNLLWVQKADGTWVKFPAILNGTRLYTLYAVGSGPLDRCLAVDAFDNLWSVSRDPSVKGVVSLGNRGDIDSTIAIHVTVADGLPSDDIRTITVDRDNDIWVGTARGIAIILDPLNPKRAGGIAAYKPLPGQVINTIAVDPLNQKWIGTNEGVILLSADGTQVLETYTVASTGGKLIDNEVRSISVDGRTGTVYIGTASGLASLTTPAAEPNASFDGLTVYPNPFIIPASSPLTIDGLVENTTLKILTADGRVVREVATPGGRLGFWDGKDASGTTVASGVYILVGYSEDGSQVGTGKVAVIRR